MKRTPSRRAKPEDGDMRKEYKVDYFKSRKNRFASRMKGTTVAIVLDPDVAEYFQSSESVNTLLRSVIAALPEPPRTGG
jgi:hypothetical protein